MKCWKQERRDPYKLVVDIDLDSNNVTESDLFFQKPRSFLNRLNDRLRKMLDRSPEDSMPDFDKTFFDFGMFMFSIVEASVFMRKKYSDSLHSIKNTSEILTLKQTFEISEQLILKTIR